MQVKDVFATTSKIFIVLELVEGGELFDKISSQGKLKEEQVKCSALRTIPQYHM
jgi:5'-AMP-activated protein kinase catalytic alpha subunit